MQKEAIILTDGGICSQIAFCVLGKYLENLNYKVKYDLSWFKNHGKDVNGVFSRAYGMDKAFPNLNLEIASDDEIKKFKHLRIDGGKYLDKLYPKMHISGYPQERTEYLNKYVNYFTDNFDPVDKNEVQDILDAVQNNNSCAVHVRRGDLSNYAVGYGAPCDRDYFIKAMDIIASGQKDSIFYFFSEELDWVRENIIPYTKHKCILVDKNDSSKGYLDLYIMSRCKNIIASQGSFGNFAKILSPDENMTLITPYYKDYIFNNFKNVIIFRGNLKNENEQISATDNLKKKLEKYKKFFKICVSFLIFFVIISIILAIMLIV